jgi:single-stranded DNA-binding protein
MDGDRYALEQRYGFSNVREQMEAAEKGDLVHITGRLRETSHGEGAEATYRTEVIADSFSVGSRKRAVVVCSCSALSRQLIS